MFKSSLVLPGWLEMVGRAFSGLSGLHVRTPECSWLSLGWLSCWKVNLEASLRSWEVFKQVLIQDLCVL